MDVRAGGQRRYGMNKILIVDGDGAGKLEASVAGLGLTYTLRAVL